MDEGFYVKVNLLLSTSPLVRSERIENKLIVKGFIYIHGVERVRISEANWQEMLRDSI